MVNLSVVRELNHVAIRVADMEASLRLYRDLLGGKVIRNARTPDGTGHFVYVQLADGVIEFIQGKPGADNLGLQHIAFLTSNDINEAAEAARARGYTFTVEPKEAASKDGYLCFFKDSGGTVYEFIQREENIRIPNLKNDRILEFDHISIRVDDESRADTEYLVKNVFQMPIRQVYERAGAHMIYYKFGPDTIELLYGADKPRPANPIIHIALRVADSKEIYRYLTENGFSATEPKESGLGGFYITNVTGPDGEIIEFLDRPSMDVYNPK